MPVVAVMCAEDLAASYLWGALLPVGSHPVWFKILCDFANKTLEGKLHDFLVVTNFKSDSSGVEMMRPCVQKIWQQVVYGVLCHQWEVIQYSLKYCVISQTTLEGELPNEELS